MNTEHNIKYTHRMEKTKVGGDNHRLQNRSLGNLFDEHLITHLLFMCAHYSFVINLLTLWVLLHSFPPPITCFFPSTSSYSYLISTCNITCNLSTLLITSTVSPLLIILLFYLTCIHSLKILF